jgi:uncharacterized protein (DUF302 family)
VHRETRETRERNCRRFAASPCGFSEESGGCRQRPQARRAEGPVVVLLVVVDWQAVQEIIVRSALKRINRERKPMLVKLSTDKTVSEAAAALQAAVQANHFGVMQVHNLKETMTKKGVEFAHECLIFEVCQPQQAKKVLDQNMSVSTALPCRISIYEEGGKTILATLKPTTLLAMFNAPQLQGVAQEVEDTIVKIMKEAASG